MVSIQHHRPSCAINVQVYKITHNTGKQVQVEHSSHHSVATAAIFSFTGATSTPSVARSDPCRQRVQKKKAHHDLGRMPLTRRFTYQHDSYTVWARGSKSLGKKRSSVMPYSDDEPPVPDPIWGTNVL